MVPTGWVSGRYRVAVAAVVVLAVTAGATATLADDSVRSVDRADSNRTNTGAGADRGGGSNGSDRGPVPRPRVGDGPGGPAVQGVADADRTYTTVITGQVLYRARNGTMMPARQVKVQVRRDQVGPANSKPFASDVTDDRGNYQIRVDTDKREFLTSKKDATLNLKVQVLARNPAAKVIAFKKNFQGGSGRVYHLSRDLAIKVGQRKATRDFRVTGRENRRAFQIADWLLSARRYTDREANFARKRVKVHYPAASGFLGGDRYYSTVDKIKINTDDWGSKNETVYHEYGHALMGALFDYSGWKIPKAKTWFGCHDTYAETAKTFAWYEGFAQYVAAAVNGSADTSGNELESTAWYNESVANTNCPNGDVGQEFDGKRVEGAVANVLWDVTDPRNEPHDDMDAPLREVFAAVSKNKVTSSVGKRNTKRVLDVDEFWNQFVTPDNHAELGRIFFEYGIQKPDRFESNDRPSAAATLSRNATVGGQLNYGDTEDHFEFAARDDQVVRVDLRQIQGDADSDLVVYRPNGSVVGADTGSSEGGLVRFRAPADGTYRVLVNDTASGKTAGTYELDLTIHPRSVLDDGYEDNDREATATPLGVGRVTDLLLTDFDRQDYYAIQGKAGETVAVTATFDDDAVDVNLLAYGPNSTAPGYRKASRQTWDDDEQVVFDTDRTATYYVVAATPNLTDGPGSYDLVVDNHTRTLDAYEHNDREAGATKLSPVLGRTAPAGDRTGTVVSGLHPDDEDVYGIQLDANEELNVTLTGGDVVGTVVSPNGNVRTLQWTGDAEAIDGPAGTYYLKVTSRKQWVPRYEFRVEYGPGVNSDRLEPNSRYRSATPSTPSIPIGGSSGTTTYRNLTIEPKGTDWDFFAVNLTAGDRLTATASYRAAAGNLSLFLVEPPAPGRDARGTPTRRGRLTSLEASLAASRDGTYYVAVLDRGSGTGGVNYDLTVDVVRSRIGNPRFKLKIQYDGFGQTIKVRVGDREVGVDLGNVSVPGDPVDPGDGNDSADGGDGGDGDCVRTGVETRSRTVSVSAGQSTRVQRTRSFTVDYADPCEIRAKITAPKRAQVDVYVTLDGSRPTPSNYQVAADGPGSNETLVVTPADGLQTGATVRVTVVAYPIAGDYDLVVEKYARSP